jgi:hypothetical protein
LEVLEPSSGFNGANEPVLVAPLQADVSRPARLTAEDGLKELAQALTLPRAMGTEHTLELEVSLKAVVQCVNDGLDPGAATE